MRVPIVIVGASLSSLGKKTANEKPIRRKKIHIRKYCIIIDELSLLINYLLFSLF